MDFKKLVITAAAGVVMLGFAIPAFGCVGFGCYMPPAPPTLTTIKNIGSVSNLVNTSANTGSNMVIGGRMGGILGTGDAISTAQVTNDINSTYIDCGCTTKSNLSIANIGSASNMINTSAKTGFNVVGGGFVGTGDAGAQSVVSNVVNTTIVGLTN